MPLLLPTKLRCRAFHPDRISACRQSLDIRRQSTSSRQSLGSRRQSMSQATRYSGTIDQPLKYSNSLLDRGELHVPTVTVSLQVLWRSVTMDSNGYLHLVHTVAAGRALSLLTICAF